MNQLDRQIHWSVYIGTNLYSYKNWVGNEPSTLSTLFLELHKWHKPNVQLDGSSISFSICESLLTTDRFIFSLYCGTGNFLRSFIFCVFENFQPIVKIKHAKISLFNWLSSDWQQEIQKYIFMGLCHKLKRKDCAHKNFLFYSSSSLGFNDSPVDMRAHSCTHPHALMCHISMGE